jgi:mannose-6-phosphate isomerase-like protein (cupin superfamily)
MAEPTFTTLDTGIPRAMRYDRGVTRHLVGPDVEAEKLDVHVNVINADSGIGPYHLHEHAENVYIVLDGAVETIIDGVRRIFRKGDVAFIPPGTPHAAGSDGSGVATVIEIYAPAGRDFVIIEDSEAIIENARANYKETAE